MLYTYNRIELSKRTEKYCLSCGILKDLSSFHKQHSSPDGHRNDCKECRKKYKDKAIVKTLPDFVICGCCNKKLPRTSEYFKGNLNAIKANKKCIECTKNYHKNISFIKSYSLSIEDVEKMKQAQDNKCYICGSSYKLVVDHNHHTNEVRAILCDSCNRGIGFLREDVDILRNTIKYLEKFK